MKAELGQRRRALRTLERRIDPRAQISGMIVTISDCLRAAGFGPESGAAELVLAKRYAVDLLRLVRYLNQKAFWRSLSIPKCERSKVFETTIDERTALVMDAIQDLRDGYATRANIIGAMDALHEAVSSMNVIFAIGKINDLMDEEWELDRSTCAYALPALAEGLGKFWMRLREQDSIK